MAQVIMDFANGELSQEWRRYKTEMSIEDYLTKSYLKTGSLIANSCLSVAELVKAPENIKAAVYGYGRNLGLAFQIVDDILDFTKSSEELGKPKVCALDMHPSANFQWSFGGGGARTSCVS